MRLPNGYGGVVKLSGNRRRPYAARITTGWYHNDKTNKHIQNIRLSDTPPHEPKLYSSWQNTMIIPSIQLH